MSNRNGPTLLRKLKEPVALKPEEFREEKQRENTLVLDVHRYGAFGGYHIPGSYNIDLEGNFATFAGWILPENAKILLVAHDREAVHEACLWLYRVGLDDISGYLEEGVSGWATAGYPLDDIGQLTPQKLDEIRSGGCKIVLVDVRMPYEYEKSHIQGAVNIPVPELKKRYRELDPSMQVALMCSSSRRSSLGASLLKQKGFTNIFNVTGGIAGYTAAGYKLI